MRFDGIGIVVSLIAMLLVTDTKGDEEVRLSAEQLSISPILKATRDLMIFGSEVAELNNKVDSTAPTEVATLDFSPDGSLLVVGDKASNPYCVLGGISLNTDNGFIYISETKLHKVTGIINPRKWKGSALAPLALRFAENGREIVAVFKESRVDGVGKVQNTYVLASYNLARRELSRKVESRTDEDWRVWALSGNGSVFVALTGSGVRIWDTASGKEQARLSDMIEEPTSIEISSNCKIIAIGNARGEVGLWELGSGRRIAHFKPHTVRGEPFETAFLTFSPDGSKLAQGGVSRSEIAPFSVEYSSKLRTFDLETLSEQLSIACNAQHVIKAAAYSPDGKTLAFVSCVAGSKRGSVSIWDAESQKERVSISNTRACTKVAFSHDGRTLLTADREWLVIREPLTGRERAELHQGEYALTLPDVVVEFSPDGKTLASSNGGLKVWNLASAIQPRAQGGHRFGVRCLAYFPDGSELATGSYDLTVKIWDLAKRRPRLTLIGHQAEVVLVASSSDGKRLASIDAWGGIRIWDRSRGSCLMRIQGPNELPRQLVFDTGDKNIVLLSGSESAGHRISRWDATTGAQLSSSAVQPTGSNPLVISADGRLALSRSGERFEQRSIETGQVQSSFLTADESVEIVLSRDGVIAYEMTQNEAIIRHRRVGTKWASARVLNGDDELITGPDRSGPRLVLSSDGRKLAVRFLESIRVLDTVKSEWCSPVKIDPDDVLGLAFSPSGESMAVAQASGDILILSLPNR